MWELPAFVAGNKTVRLPLTEWAAQRISAALLAEGAEQRREFFVEALREEPPLLLWVLCVAAPFRESPPRSLDEIATWLGDEALACLVDSPPIRLCDEALPFELRQRWANLAMQAARVELPRAVTAPTCPPPVAARQFRQYVVEPQAWVIDGGSGDEFLPNWLRRSSEEVSESDAAATVDLTDGGIHLDEPRAERLRQTWLTTGSPSIDILGPLLTHLRRLEQLEHDFSRQLRDAKLAALKELAYGASHEINNPLANIATRAQTLLADEPDPERRRKLATIAAQAFRAHEMISDLMLFARPPVLRRQRTDLVGTVASVLHEFTSEARARQVNLRRMGRSEPLWADVDPTQLGVALQALVRNALEATDGAGDVEVTLTTATDARRLPAKVKALIAVHDHGKGIAPTAREHLFDPFFSGREAGRGLGFGLSKCWRIVTDHGGDVRVEDAEGGGQGRGTTFIIELPLDGGDAAPE